MPDWSTVTLSGASSAILTAVILGFWKPWFGAYGGEKGKNLARKEDLDAILTEVKAITITQKEIESSLSGDLWNRQMRWNEKRDIYLGIIKEGMALMRQYVAVGVAARTMDANPGSAHHSEVLRDDFTTFLTLEANYSYSLAAAELFVSEQTAELFKTIALVAPASVTYDWAMNEGRKLQEFITKIIELGKVDLQFRI